jgi:cell division protein FtsW
MIKKIDKQLLILTIILFSIGLIMIYSASNVTAFMVNESTPWRYFIREIIFMTAGLIGSIILMIIPFKGYYKLSLLTTLFFAGAIFCLIVWGTVTNGATNWIGYKGLGIQPSEFIKITSIPLFALYYEKNRKYQDNKIRMITPLILGMIITILIIAQKDWGTAVIYASIVIFMFFFSNASKKIKLDIFKKGLVLLVFGILLIAFAGDKILGDKIERFNFNAPCDRYLTDGNQLCNGFIAMNGGGLFGKGLGNSTQKYLYLPEPYTDFIFAIFVEELGLVGAVGLFILYLLLIVRIVVIGKKSNKESHTLMCYTIAFYIFIHIAINIGGVLGIIPMTGVTLPFLSYGGSICVSIIAALTIVQKVAIETKKSVNKM